MIYEAGQKHGLRLVGTQALESLRLEKSYRAMFRDMNLELTAWESTLDRFIDMDKGPFIGREALAKSRDEGVASKTVTLKIPTDGKSVIGSEGLYRDGKLVGRVTSGGYSYTFGHDIAIALLPVELGAPGAQFDLTILGDAHQATVIEESPYDPTAARARA